MIDYKCPVCGTVTYSSAPLLKVKCSNCGCEYSVSQNQQASGYAQEENNTPYTKSVGNGVFDNGPSGRSRGVAALLAILLGYLGIHYFYVGKNTAGIICLIFTLLSCGFASALLAILGLIQGVLMLTMSEQEFEERYIYTTSTFPF